MVPLRKEAALDYHRMGSKIYCLGSDGSKGEYASKEMIQAHEGLFGMESQMWERIEENDLDYADEDFGAFQESMSVIEQEERVAKDKYVNTQELNKILREEIAALLTENNTVDSDDFTVPSNLVIAIAVTSVAKVNCLACSNAF